MGGKDDTMTTGEATLTRAGGATFMGHPKGLFYLAFTEARERFSFYGMTPLVVLYMVNPGEVCSWSPLFGGRRPPLQQLSRTAGSIHRKRLTIAVSARGGFYEKMSPAEFWAMHAAIAGGGLLVVLFGRRLSRALQTSDM